MRRSLCALLALGAASSCGGGSNSSTAPSTTSTTSTAATVATVSLSTTTATLQPGGTVTLVATAVNSTGGSISGKTVSWTSSATSVATVSSAGLVTAVSAGVALITATIDAKSSQATITVTANCGTVPLALALGEVRTLSGAERSGFCLAGGATGSEYVLIPYKTADTITSTVPLSFTSQSTVTVTTSPLVSSALSSPVTSSLSGQFPRHRVHDAFEARLRASERRDLGPMWRASRAAGRSAFAQSNITGLPVTPTVGTTVQMNINVKDACTNRSNRTGRVAAVSKNAIIVADSASPAGGFTDADYATFATTFDTLIYALDTAAFGAPTDLDGNNKIVIFFTPAVNALSKDADGGYIAGFFYSRDLFPQTAQPGISACPGSNYAEMFYMPVVDPTQVYNKFFTSKTVLQTDAVGTLAHEMQHLINDSRRIYINNADDYEQVWLDEGLSHLAQELLYYKVSGFTPKSDLNLSTIASTQVKVDAINAYQVDNLGNFMDYLAAPETHSPVAMNDSLETRGSTWSLLRYALDQGANAPATYTRALVNSNLVGTANFNNAFSGAFSGGIVTALRQMALASFLDNSGISTDTKFAYASWNFRSILPAITKSKLFPLLTHPLTPTVPAAFTLRSGAAGYVRFGVIANATATINSASGVAAVPATIELLLVRTK